MSRLNQRISLSFLFLCALWFGVMDGAIVGSPEFNQNPIIEGNALIVTCTTNSVGTPDIELQVNGQAATGFSSSVSGQTVNFTMESVSRSLQGGQIRCMDRSDSTFSGVVILIVYYAPQVSVSQSVFDVVTGESVSIGYSITEGNPANPSNFSVFWNGAFINPVQYERNATYITFDDISSNFRGNYVIRVSNVAGSGEATFVFNEKSGAERSTTDSCTASYCQPIEVVSTDAACRTSLGIGVAVPIAVLIVVNIISVVVAVLVSRHCYKKTSQTSSPSKGEDVYDQVEGPKTYEDIAMTDSPAYGLGK